MKKIAVFDVDGVIVRGQTQQLLVEYLFRKKKLNIYYLWGLNIWFLMYKLGLIRDVIKIRQRVFQVVKNWDVFETRLLFRSFFNEVVRKNIIIETVGLINEHKKNGYEIILVSASLKEIIDEIAVFLGIKEAVATKLEQNKGFYTGKIEGAVCHGSNKVFLLKDLVKSKNFTFVGSFGYTDDYSDIPLLNLVETPFVVNPDFRLEKFATSQSLKTYVF